MDREKTLSDSMYKRPQMVAGIELQPFSSAIGQILQERNNRFAGGSDFEPTMREINELMFVLSTPIQCLLEIDDNNWRKEVLLFASSLTAEQIGAIEEYANNEAELVRASQTKSAGKPKGGRRR